VSSTLAGPEVRWFSRIVTVNELGLQWLVESRPSGRYPSYTRRHIDEDFPSVVSPLSWTGIAGERLERAGREALVRLGAFGADEFGSEAADILGVFSGYCYLNTSVQRTFARRVRDATAGGPGAPVRLIDSVRWALSGPGVPAIDEAERAVAALRGERPNLSRLSSRQLLERARSVIDRWSEPLLREHTFVTWATMIPAVIIMSACAERGEPGRALHLIQAADGIASARPAWSLWHLARLVADSPSLIGAFDDLPDDVLSGMPADLEYGPAFADAFATFLVEFGSRGPNEWDLSAPTWETHPGLALAAIDRLRMTVDDRFPEDRRRRLATEADSAELLDGMAADRPIRELLERATRAVGSLLHTRERSKAAIVRMHHEARMPLHEIARRMVEQGYLHRIADFGLLTLDEFPAFLDDPDAFAGRITDRRTLYDRLTQLRPPPVLDGRAPSVATSGPVTDDELLVTTAGNTVRGLPASPGRATGAARVVTNPAELSHLRPGDILVAPVSGATWIPLILASRGLLIEAGSPLNHAGLAAREFGVPAVVGCPGATRRVLDGAVVTVDGSAGTVTVEDPAPTVGHP